MNDIFLPKLSQNLLEILDNDDEYHDIIIEVGNDPYVKIFRAHMVILNYRSPYLRRILSTNKKRTDGTLAQIKLPNILPETFQVLLRYIYGGRLLLEEYDPLDIIKILVDANQLNIQELIPYLQSFLIKNKENWMKQNFDFICQTSFENDSFLELQKYCTDLIYKAPVKELFESANFSLIPEKLVISFIQNTNLQMSEVQLWEYILKWGFAQNPELPLDPTGFSKDDFNALKITLQQCIPLIRFYNLTSDEFADKVLPYKKILPKDLYQNLLKYFLNPNSKKSNPYINKNISPKDIDSNIITFRHSKIISKWIDGFEFTDKIYEFQLIFRGSRDGFSARKFHRICDNQSQTVSIIKLEGSDEILGGYNPIVWKSANSIHDYGITKDSFIFSFLKNNHDDSIGNYILSRVTYPKGAINYYSKFGPSFGGGDLMTVGDRYKESYCVQCSYEKPIRKTNDEFSVEEYEIFLIK